MKKAIAYEIINHGYDHAQYFQGCGVSLTDYDVCCTGIGDTAKEAYMDAVEQAWERDIDCSILPNRPRGINAKDKVPARLLNQEDNEFYYCVSIRLKVR
jgi:hypothetical protein